MIEPSSQFEKRKQDHIRFALDPSSQAEGQSGLDRISLVPEALPELDFEQINLSRKLFGTEIKAPIFISSMTAGHTDSGAINLRLARAAEAMGWMMGVGSQRRELFDEKASIEWRDIRALAPKALLVGNLGLSQLIKTPSHQVQKLVDELEAKALFVHLNPLQECLQIEGTPQFSGGLRAIERLCKELSVPVIIKEVGCGISANTLKRLAETGVTAVDVAGFGGTHWGRIEGLRAGDNTLHQKAAQSFWNWGMPTVDCMVQAQDLKLPFELWASGGVRSGLDVAKVLALGAKMVGLAKPFLAAALEGEETLLKAMQQFEFELKIALFCSGFRTPDELIGARAWTWTSNGK